MFDWLELYWTDSYKTGHKFMLPEGSLLMYSNFTPRSGKLANIPDSKGVVSIGQQMTMRKMKRDWDQNFFSRPVEEIHQFGRDMTKHLMLEEPYDVSHFLELHELGYLPIRIKSLEEGTFVPYKVPMTTIVNTKQLSKASSDFIVNYLETILSSESWQAPTSATTALAYKRLGKEWIEKTCPEMMWFLDYQFHDFSMRGMGGKSGIINSSMGFSAVSKGTDCIAVIPAWRSFYDARPDQVEHHSVIATEHAIMCTLTGFYLKTLNGDCELIGKLELETFRELLKRFPTGILSIVSDTWDLWRVIVDYMTTLKKEIMARKGKVVLRPDSGDPVDIVTGEDIVEFDTLELAKDHFRYNMMGDLRFKIADKYYKVIMHSGTEFKHEEIEVTPVIKGVIQGLWDIFGGTISSTGYKILDEHVGAIYGDSITYDRAKRIFERLEAKGFASCNIVLGVGSYSLQYVTRDTHGFAQKATYVEVTIDNKREGIEIFKDPVTDNGMKKSAKGLMVVYKDENDDYFMEDQVEWDTEQQGELRIIFEDGNFLNETTYEKITQNIARLVEKTGAYSM